MQLHWSILTLVNVTVTVSIGKGLANRLRNHRPPQLLNTLRCTCGHDTNEHRRYLHRCLSCECDRLVVAMDHPWDLDQVEAELGWTSPPFYPQPSRSDMWLMLAMGLRVSEWDEMGEQERDHYRTLIGVTDD